MSKELILPYTTGKTVYAIIFSAIGQAWNTSGTPAFEALTSAHWTQYAITLTEQATATGIYEGDFPSAIAAGSYGVIAYNQAGGSPATTDLPVGEEQIPWTGSGRASDPWGGVMTANQAATLLRNSSAVLLGQETDAADHSTSQFLDPIDNTTVRVTSVNTPIARTVTQH